MTIYRSNPPHLLKNFQLIEKGTCKCGGEYQIGMVDEWVSILHTLPYCDPYFRYDFLEFAKYIKNEIN